MKQALLSCLTSLLFNVVQAQKLPVVTAVGGEGVNVNWSVIKAEEEKEEDGPGYFYHDCAQGVRPTGASSTLEGQGGKSYGISNLSDDDPMTAWVEGVKGYGIGEWFEVDAGGVNTIYNGYQSSPLNWKNNSRVKRFKVYVNDTAVCYLDLTDEMGRQSFDLDVGEASYDHPKRFRFEIVQVYKGDKWDDVAVSHVDEFACCYAENTLISSVSGGVLAGAITKGTSVLAFDPAADTVSSSVVTLNSSQQHVTLLHVVAGGKSIDITPDHPLYIEGKGFTSLKSLRTAPGDTAYTTLAGEYSVLLWNEESQSSYYAPIERVEVLHGMFNTDTIRGLDKGTSYITNGFISKTY